MGDMGRSQDPGKAGLVKGHLPFPSLHGNDSKVTFHPVGQEPLAVQVEGQLSDRHSVYIRNGKLAHEGEESRTGEQALHFNSSQGIGPVQNHKADVVFCRGLHGQSQRADVGIGAGADVLDIIYQHVNPLQHLRRGFTGFPVNAVHRQTGMGVGVILHVVTGSVITANPMLGTEKRHQVKGRGGMEEVDRRSQRTVYSGRIGDESHSFPLQKGESRFFQNFKAGSDFPGTVKKPRKKEQDRQHRRNKRTCFHFNMEFSGAT